MLTWVKGTQRARIRRRGGEGDAALEEDGRDAEAVLGLAQLGGRGG